MHGRLLVDLALILSHMIQYNQLVHINLVDDKGLLEKISIKTMNNNNKKNGNCDRSIGIIL